MSGPKGISSHQTEGHAETAIQANVDEIRNWIGESYGPALLAEIDSLSRQSDVTAEYLLELIPEALENVYAPSSLVLEELATRPCDSSGVRYACD